MSLAPRSILLVSLGFSAWAASTGAEPARPADLTAATRDVKTRLGVRTCTLHELQLPACAGEPIALDVPIDGRQRRLLLQPHSIRAPGFRVRVECAGGKLEDVAIPPVTTYRGRVAGQDGERVTASIVDRAISAQVIAGDATERTWVVQPLQQVIPGTAAGVHVVYPADEVVTAQAGCALESSQSSSPAKPQIETASAAAVPLDTLTCEIACDADVEYYQLNGSSIDSTVADIESVLNAMSTIWERDLRMHFVITEILVRTTEPDPFSTNNPYALLNDLRNDWRANHADIPRDVTQLFTGRTLTTGIGIGDSDGGICSTYYGYSIVRSRYTTDMALRVALSAHELGHNFYGSHCDYDDWWCRIMCSSLGGCSAATHSFGPSEVTAIRNYAAGRTCLSAGSVDLTTASFPFSDDFFGNGSLDPVRWTAVDNVSRSTNYMQMYCGSSYSGEYQKFGTARTLPIPVHRPVLISYRTRPSGVPTAHTLKVEYLKSSTYQWALLESVTTPGGTPSTWTPHQIPLPPDGYGDYFALRFTSYGPGVYSSYWWHIDDVRVAIAPVPGDYDNDGDVDLLDFDRFLPCVLGPSIPQTDPGCSGRDLTGDGDVDADDFGAFQRCWSGETIPGNPACRLRCACAIAP